MIFKKLPPVRRPVPILGSKLRGDESERVLVQWANPYKLSLFGSGTEALAAALLVARRVRDTPSPEVILPAYGCPDLVAACIFAGVSPRLVDIADHGWGYDEVMLRSALNSNTVAIVAVNLLGVGDQASHLRSVADEYQLMLVQDSAQYLPENGRKDWVGDAIVLSFGRGKPLNLLGGGALLIRSDDERLIASSSDCKHQFHAPSKLLALAFNVATHPLVYWLTSSVPGFHVGETRYVSLNECRSVPGPFVRQFATALHEFIGRENYSAQKWLEVVEGWHPRGIELLLGMGTAKSDYQYLRLPLLAPTEPDRNSLVATLSKRGFGATAMYRQTLINIAGVPAVAGQGPFPNAEVLAGRLFTLPTHDCINASVISEVGRIVNGAMR